MEFENISDEHILVMREFISSYELVKPKLVGNTLTNGLHPAMDNFVIAKDKYEQSLRLLGWTHEDN